MIGLKEALMLHMKNNKKFISWEKNSSEYIGKAVAYNSALDFALHFIKKFEAGEVEQEYLIDLKKRQG